MYRVTYETRTASHSLQESPEQEPPKATSSGYCPRGLLRKEIDASFRVARTMVTCLPYTTWPLHAKLFTDEAVKYWNALEKDADAPLPRGFTFQVELEGVDGKSGQMGSSGRTGPIDVTDGAGSSIPHAPC
jgi:hypothetical protein